MCASRWLREAMGPCSWSWGPMRSSTTASSSCICSPSCRTRTSAQRWEVSRIFHTISTLDILKWHYQKRNATRIKVWIHINTYILLLKSIKIACLNSFSLLKKASLELWSWKRLLQDSCRARWWNDFVFRIVRAKGRVFADRIVSQVSKRILMDAMVQISAQCTVVNFMVTPEGLEASSWGLGLTATAQGNLWMKRVQCIVFYVICFRQFVVR